ncbi:MAG: hypothetical protein QM770_21775 [Tepidisphaeraceae bacterium]
MPKVVAAADEFGTRKAAVESVLKSLDALPLANLFAGVAPLLIAVLVIAGAVAAMQPWNRDIRADIGLLLGVGAGAAVLVVIIGFILKRLSDKQVARTFGSFVNELAHAHGALDQRLIDAEELRKKTIADAEATRASENERIKNHFQPLADKLKTKRDELLQRAGRQHEQAVAHIRAAHEAETLATRRAHESNIRAAERERDDGLSHAMQHRDTHLRAAKAVYDADRADLERRWNEGLASTKAQNAITDAAGCVRFGSLNIDLEPIANPVIVQKNPDDPVVERRSCACPCRRPTACRPGWRCRNRHRYWWNTTAPPATARSNCSARRCSACSPRSRRAGASSR